MPDGSFNSTDKQRRCGRGSGGITGRGFQPGRSGCPGGRPRQDVTELARAHTADAIRALVEALKRPKEAVPAAIALLDRGWGRPTQTIAADSATSPIALHLIAAQMVSQQIIERQLVVQQPQTPIQREQPQLQRLLDAPPPTE